MSGMLSHSGNGCCVVGITSHCTLCDNGFDLRAFQKTLEKSRNMMSIESRRDYGFNASLDSLWFYIPIIIII